MILGLEVFIVVEEGEGVMVEERASVPTGFKSTFGELKNKINTQNLRALSALPVVRSTGIVREISRSEMNLIHCTPAKWKKC